MRFESWVKLIQLSAVERALVRKIWRFRDARTSGGVTVVHTDVLPLRAIGVTGWAADDPTSESLGTEWVSMPQEPRQGLMVDTRYFPNAKLLATRSGSVMLFRFVPRPFTFAQAVRFGDLGTGARAAATLDWALESGVHGAANAAEKLKREADRALPAAELY